MAFKTDEKPETSNPVQKHHNAKLCFAEELDDILGAHRLSFFSQQTFKNNAKKQARAHGLSHILPYLGIGLAPLGLLIGLREPIAGGAFLVASLTSIVIGLRYGKTPSSQQYNKLMEGATNPIVAKIVLDWANGLASSDIKFYQHDGDNAFKEISKKCRVDENMPMVLLGDDLHLKALKHAKDLQNTPFYFSKHNYETVFSPLKEALSQLPEYEHFKPDYEPESVLKQPSTQSPAAEKSSKLQQNEDIKKAIAPEELRIEDAKRRGTYYKKRSPKAKDYLHLKAILNSSYLMNLFLDYTKSDDFKTFVLKTNKTRGLWVEVFQFIYDHWNEWCAYKNNPYQISPFAKKLFGPGLLNYKAEQPEKRKKFRKGEHREMSDFIIDCFILPTDELTSTDQLDLIDSLKKDTSKL